MQVLVFNKLSNLIYGARFRRLNCSIVFFKGANYKAIKLTSAEKRQSCKFIKTKN